MRLLHTMLRVGNLERSLDFYCEGLGMQLKGKKDFPAGRFTLAFVGYEGEDSHALEFTYNYGRENYEIGDGYGHVAVGVNDIHTVCERLRARGAKITREPGPMKHGSTVIAFVEDPDGYPVELIETAD